MGVGFCFQANIPVRLTMGCWERATRRVRSLDRRWRDGERAVADVCEANPSKAGSDDPTLRTSRGRALVEVTGLFLKLGLTAFGGPAAHIAMLEDEVVRRRAWLTREEFLDLLGATNLIPGPNSTELAIHIGYRRAGWAGFVLAGLGFILPAMVMVTAIAWAYVRFGSLPRAEGLLVGVKPVILIVIVQALGSLAGKAVKDRFLAGVGVVAVGLVLAGVHELAVLFGAGLAVVLLGAMPPAREADAANSRRSISGPWWMLGAVAPASASVAASGGVAFGLGPLFWVFLKIGSVLFGSGYVLLAFLRADLVERRGWLTEAQLVDAVAVGQFTPGPIFTAATFVGYLLDGVPGAVVATVGIFLPAFVFVALSGPWIPKLRASPTAGRFLDGVNVASLALMGVVTLQLAQVALVDGFTVGVALVAGVLSWRFRVNTAWLVLGGGIAGYLRIAANLP